MTEAAPPPPTTAAASIAASQPTPTTTAGENGAHNVVSEKGTITGAPDGNVETTTVPPSAIAAAPTAPSTTTPAPTQIATQKADQPTQQPAETNNKSTASSLTGTDNNDSVNPLDFQGSVDSNHDLPSEETLKRIENYVVLDRDGKSHPFKSLYTGKHVARRVLIIFVRHFYCGNCQQYLRVLTQHITPESLLRLPISTFIAVIGCGDPGLIDMYASESGCPFPIYADPTRKLYDELGMIRTLALGDRPAYIKKSIIKSSFESVVQGLKQVPKGLAAKGGDARQIGGEFLFEPLSVQSPITTPWAELDRNLADIGATLDGVGANGEERSSSSGENSLDGKVDQGVFGGEEKQVTWCHRMKNTRDHAEIPELMEVLGLDGNGMPLTNTEKDRKRWERALESRKGTGLSMASQMSALKMASSGASSVRSVKEGVVGTGGA
ncbi:AhpC/TSA antioxidant enzyme-domain-containing protein [Diplogelasinospora grovesii]|uniref:AhpC/TSA antioxidant enzyme-domain-containing protein n=1 Tax=Diplogelasinospora grovesii TaxID=303347 RepID=A0AAN6S6J6_9PEZI|nr:AhpC/TSA antioxidant enzyme-domain-containing protein [Diplogelasinospora grovesii]